MTRLELTEEIRKSFVAGEFGGSEVYVSETTDVAPEDDTGFGTFSVHVGGLDADIFHVHVYKE
jgi:hypothetical protein